MRPLSNELTELENRLAARTVDGPTAALRDRVMQSVTDELALQQKPSSIGQSEDWNWVAIAASVLLVINVSMISASRNEFSIWSAQSRNQTVSEIQAIRLIQAQQEGTFK